MGCVLLLLGLLPVRQPVDPPGQRHGGSTSLLSCQAWDGQIVRILAGGGRLSTLNMLYCHMQPVGIVSPGYCGRLGDTLVQQPVKCEIFPHLEIPRHAGGVAWYWVRWE